MIASRFEGAHATAIGPFWGVRTALVLALLACYLSPGTVNASRVVELAVDARFPSGTPTRIVIVQRSKWGAFLVRHEVDHEASLPLTLADGVDTIEVSTPVHEACVVPVGPSSDVISCRLLELVRIDPFQEGGGEIWKRRVGGETFDRVGRLPEGWGDGFAIGNGRYDLVLAPSRRCALMALDVLVSDQRSVGSPRPRDDRPFGVRARFVGALGGAITDTPEVDVPGSTAATASPTLLAWRQLLRALPVDQGKDGTLLLKPALCEPLSLVVSFPGRQPVVLDTAAGLKEPGGILDLGTISLPRLAHVETRVANGLAESLQEKRVTLKGRLLRPAEGLSMPTTNRQLERDFGDELSPVLAELFPGRWMLELRVDGRTYGEKSIDVEEGDRVEETFGLGLLRLAGRVEESTGKAAVGVLLEFAFLTDGQQPRARVVSARDGSFDVTIPHCGGPVQIVVSPPAGGHRYQTVDPSREDVEKVRIVLGGGEVTVVVRDSVTNAPVPEVLVSARQTAQNGSVAGLRERTDLEGRVRFSRLDDGEIAIDYVGSEDWLADPDSLRLVRRISREEPGTIFEVRVRAAGKVEVSNP